MITIYKTNFKKSQIQKQPWIIFSFSLLKRLSMTHIVQKKIDKGKRSKTPVDEAEAAFVGKDICSRKVAFV